MKRVLLLMASMLVFCQLEAQTIYYVSQGGTADGSSWAKALGDLHKALEKARPGDEIWVSRGTYHTSGENDRTRSFVIPPGVGLFGGFAGSETSREQRDVKKNTTHLSGEIGTASFLDNAYTVVYFQNAGEETTLDGFFILGGAADGQDKNRLLEFKGGGIFNLATNGQSSSPNIRNCTITRNYAREGAGIFNLAREQGDCSPRIANCAFIKNKADLDGGAIMNVSIDGHCSPRITKCHFEANVATYGGAIFNEPHGGSVKPTISSNIFKNNKAFVNNGSIHNEYSGEGSCQPVMEHNYFEGNTASVGQEKNSPPEEKPHGFKR
ncbi:MAG: DUF1565 domain-containing protein [Phaeodactylibacter sp.]|nr:DUF1565 domain-containing protein [Phaeodactylibacter sp.]MCB9296581.1 DUF1565 domain-containing protein [Lewinellaceae bacterium]